MIRAIDRKLLRDLWHIRSQALAVALVIAAGIAIYVSMFSTFASLDLTLTTYYDRYRFADVFATLKRAPLSLADRLGEIPGVAQLETRVVMDVTLDVPGLAEPAVGRLISIPEHRRPMLNDVFLRKGRYIEPYRPDEVLASETFAGAHGLEPGDSLAAVINGRRRELRIVGLALSPEYIYQIRPGELMPDEARFGVLWMERRALASAFDMDGAFNDVALKLMRGASDPEVRARLDDLLEPDFGGLGAVPRRLQPSNWYLANELEQLQGSGVVIPVVFLGVAAFLLNVVLSRIVSVQRPQIAAMKALGYSNRAVAIHYVKWALVVALAGATIGIGVGAWLGAAMTRVYAVFFHFPILLYRLDAGTLVGAVAIAVIAAVLGAFGAVRRVLALPPAEAMRPEPPARFTVSWVERAGARRWLSQPARMIFRALQRHPGRATLSVVGIALGGALLVLGNFSRDAFDVLMEGQFSLAQRFDVAITLVQPSSASVVHDIERLPGVVGVEPFRAVPVRMRFGHRSRHLALTGIPPAPRLNRLVDTRMRVVDLPPEGLVLSSMLAELLGAGRGDIVTVEVLEGARPVRQIPVADLVDDYVGANAYMELGALHRLMQEDRTVSGAYLAVDSSRAGELYRHLKATPRVAGVLLKRAAIDSFQETLGQMMLMVRILYVVFASVIAFGVVYNSARISLSERSRELATLRVIGFTRAEISYVLLGELAILTLVAVPVGMVTGYGIVVALEGLLRTEMWRIPVVVEPRTYAFASSTIVVATTISALIVRRRLDRLDLVEVLKTRE
jgi:putative ABC transport system permease protein